LISLAADSRIPEDGKEELEVREVEEGRKKKKGGVDELLVEEADVADSRRISYPCRILEM